MPGYSMDMGSLIGGRRPRGLPGHLRDPLEGNEEAQRRRAEEMFATLPGNAPTQPQTLGDVIGQAPQAPKGFWQGGGKFTGRDALAGLLAAVGDAFASNNGGRGTAVETLGNYRKKGVDAFEEAVKAHRRNQQIAQLPGMTQREFLAYSADPKGWGGHMADALSTHHAAANVNPGDQRLFGNPDQGGSIYQAPTAAEQYAGALGETTGTPGYRTALQDYTLRGSGPTAYGFDVSLDDHRTANDMGLEGLRQQNRTALRGMPTYRDMNPLPPRVGGSPSPRRKAAPTATGPNGEKVQWNGSGWVPIR